MTTFSIVEAIPVAKQVDGAFHFSLPSLLATLKLLDPKLPLFCKYENLFCEAIQKVTGQQFGVEWRTTVKISERENELIFYQSICIPGLTDQDHLAKATEIVHLILSKPEEEHESADEYNSHSIYELDEKPPINGKDEQVHPRGQKALELEDSILHELPNDYSQLLKEVANAAEAKFKETQEKLPQNRNKSTIQSIIPKHSVIVSHSTKDPVSPNVTEIRQPSESIKSERENTVEEITIEGILSATRWVRRTHNSTSNLRSTISIEREVEVNLSQPTIDEIESNQSNTFENVTVLIPIDLEISGECKELKESFPQTDRDRGLARKVKVKVAKSLCSGEHILIQVLEVE